MSNVKVYINTKESFGTWGVGFTDGSVSALMTPCPKKEYVSNKSALEPGKRVVTASGSIPKTDEREVKLNFYLTAINLADFFMKYHSLCEELKKGYLEIDVNVRDGDTFFTVAYHLVYLSCQQYTEFNGRLAKFILRLCEPNPENREIVHSEDIVI